jgi:hypothetical protein
VSVLELGIVEKLIKKYLRNLDKFQSIKLAFSQFKPHQIFKCGDTNHDPEKSQTPTSRTCATGNQYHLL